VSVNRRAAGPPVVQRVGQPEEVPSALRDLTIRTGRPVLVAVGGAGGMTPEYCALVGEIMKHLMGMLEGRGAAIVDGGTDAGVMKVMGQARRSTGASVPLIGVAAEGTVALPGQPARADAARLDRNHTHAILVPGAAWGDESPWLSRVATAIAGGQSSLTLVLNGGQITYDDIEHSLEADRPVIVLAGTGRTADAIAAAAKGVVADPRAARIAASPDTRIISVDDPPDFYSAVGSILGPPLANSSH
jgi:hypothetical protein